MSQSSVFRRHSSAPHPEIIRGEGVYLYDTDGRRYIDASGGALVVSVGHGVAEIADAAREQTGRLAYVHGSEFTSPTVEALAREMARRAPMEDARLFLVSGGSEATETAIKLARAVHVARGDRGRYKVVYRWPSYHGASLGALAVSGRPLMRGPFAPMLASYPHVPAPYPYRCTLRDCGEQCSLACAAELDATIRREGPGTVAAFIAEPVVGASAGAVVPPPGYYQMVREICDRHGVLFIADEVMSGVGRTGRWFGIEHWPGASPDIVTCGKGLTSGYIPGGAVLARGRLADEVSGRGGFPHGFTYSHHPVVAAVGLAVLRYVERHGLVAKAEAAGAHLLKRLGGLLDLPAVGEVRGLGLLTAVEIVADRATRASYPGGDGMAERIQAEAMRRGVVVYASGGQDQGAGDLLLVGPPFTITNLEIDEAVSTLGDAIAAVTRAESRRPAALAANGILIARRRTRMDETAVPTTTGVAKVFDLHALKAFAPDRRVRKMLFKTDQLWSEIACYEPGQSTVMHQHPREEEAIFVLEGTAHMSIDGQEVVVPAGAIVQFPNAVLHDVRNPGPGRCVIMFVKVNPKVLKASAEEAAHG